MKLNQLSDNPGSRKSRIRVGRGIGSGKGKTGGRGVKGQKSRSGVAVKAFEGGQMPLHRRMPKRGFNAIAPLVFAEVNVGRIQAAIDAGKLDAGTAMNADTLLAAGVVRRKLDGVRLLGDGELKAKITLEVEGASKSAIAAVEKAGGKLTVLKPAKAAESAEDGGKAAKKKKKKASQATDED